MIGGASSPSTGNAELLGLLQTSVSDEDTKKRIDQLVAAQIEHDERLRRAEAAEVRVEAAQKKVDDTKAALDTALAEVDAKHRALDGREELVFVRETECKGRQLALDKAEREHADKVAAHDAQHQERTAAAERAQAAAQAAQQAADAAKAEHDRLAAELRDKLAKLKAIAAE